MAKGFLEEVVLMILVVVTCFLILFILPNLLWIWQNFSKTVCSFQIGVINGCPKPPVTLETIIKPEYIPLTADHALFSLLDSKDRTTGLEIQEILALATNQKSKTVTISGSTYDLDLIVQQKMNVLAPG